MRLENQRPGTLLGDARPFAIGLYSRLLLLIRAALQYRPVSVVRAGTVARITAVVTVIGRRAAIVSGRIVVIRAAVAIDRADRGHGQRTLQPEAQQGL